MTRSDLPTLRHVLAALCLIGTPLQAEVGHDPAKSPYRDIRAGLYIVPAGGYFFGSGGQVGVAPHDGPIGSLQFAFLADKTISILGGFHYGMLDRVLVDPTVAKPTDTYGVHTHGTKQLRTLMKNFRSGRLDAQAVPKVVAQGPSWAIIDGHYAMPMTSSYVAMDLAIQKAKSTGVAYVGVKHSSHYGAAGYYANMAAKKDMIGLSMCNVDPCMTVPGSRGKILGTNPIAYAVPA